MKETLKVIALALLLWWGIWGGIFSLQTESGAIVFKVTSYICIAIFTIGVAQKSNAK